MSARDGAPRTVVRFVRHDVLPNAYVFEIGFYLDWAARDFPSTAATRHGAPGPCRPQGRSGTCRRNEHSWSLCVFGSTATPAKSVGAVGRGAYRVRGTNIESPSVTRGLDPRVHHLRKNFLRRRWIAGSSPAMTRAVADFPIEIPGRNYPTRRAPRSSRQNLLCCPASPRAGMRTIFCGSETAVPITCATRPCALRIASVRSAEGASTT